ncbi:hypothetical protein [Pedobacter nyackensis]|uniref:hypothetical protein n=1 Tax=Pedobacter nyackensis TaxID=475255 RepID=UPI00292E48BF|nr:hypothetical protein [Pedobacter nyackensis]
MKKSIFFTMLALISIQSYAQKENNQKWNFNNLDGWKFEHQDENPSNQCEIDNGILKIFTRAQSWDRKKVRTAAKKYTSGRYTWRTYIPQMGEKDQASVGSWIYCDDHHELDFEVGYGNAAVRKQLNAAPDDMIAYMTSQDFPSTSVPVTIKPGWHIFEIDLTIKDNKYYVTWLIDKKKQHGVQLQFGNEISFAIYCSVENLKFLGDRIPQQDNYGLYDFVKYQYHK